MNNVSKFPVKQALNRCRTCKNGWWGKWDDRQHCHIGTAKKQLPPKACISKDWAWWEPKDESVGAHEPIKIR